MHSDLSELPPWATELLEASGVARLGLVDSDGHPRVLPVTFAIAEGRIWSAIDDKPKRDPEREPARVRYLRRDPRAALTVDRYSDDWSELAWVQALGGVRVLALEEGPAGLAALEAKYEPYRDSRPRGPLLELTPERLIVWRASDGA